MKRLLTFIFALTSLMVAQGGNVVVNTNDYRITFSKSLHTFNIEHLKGGQTSPMLMNVRPEAIVTDEQGNEKRLSTDILTKVKVQKRMLHDASFGKGRLIEFIFSANGQKEYLIQRFYDFDNTEGLLTSLSVNGGGNEIKSNYIAPLCTTEPYTLFTPSNHNRMLKVPYDNDSFVRYHRYRLNDEMISYEVTALYEGDSRHGVIIGSVDHDHWKSAVSVKASDDSKIDALKAFSGVSTNETHDVLPHGYLHGKEVSSARFFIGYNDDWRDGMNMFAVTCLNVAPRNDSWTGGTPMGWQSWGVLADHCNNDDVTATADYYAQVLQQQGFHNSLNKTVISIDSWSNMSDEQLLVFAEHAGTQNQITGFYMCPFSLWWGAGDKDKYVATVDGVDYTVRDICVRVNGEPYIYDGCFCRDPTHPVNKRDIVNFVNSCAEKGIRYIKCDFISCGMIQSDSYYDESVTTAVEAYNQGMKLLSDCCREKGIFIAESISPVFPYQYANSRRTSCDTWGRIDQTEYSMNALSGGWWTGLLYQYNDPDHVVLVGHGDQADSTEGENRARYTNAAITGMMLVADNFSDANHAHRGNPVLSKERVQKIMLNKDVNEIVDMGLSFRPLRGYDEHLDSHERAEYFHYFRNGMYLYLAGINYNHDKPLRGSIDLCDLDINADEISEVKELWTGEIINAGKSLEYDIPAKDARIYRFTFRR